MPGITSTNPYGSTDYFYSDSRGVDAAFSGAVGTPEAPFKTITHLNDTLRPNIVPGDRIFFRSGDEWLMNSNQAGTGDGDLEDLSIAWNPSADPTGWDEPNVFGAYEGDTEATVITENVSVKPVFINVCNGFGFGRTWEPHPTLPNVWTVKYRRKDYGGPIFENGRMVEVLASETEVAATSTGGSFNGAGSVGRFTVDTIQSFLTDSFEVTFTTDHNFIQYESIIFEGVTWDSTDINGENLRIEAIVSTDTIRVTRTAHGNTSGSGGEGVERRCYYRPRKNNGFGINPNSEVPEGKAKIFATTMGNRSSGTTGLRSTAFIYLDAGALYGAQDHKYIEIRELDIRHSQLCVYKSTSSSQEGLKVHDCDVFSVEDFSQLIAAAATEYHKDIAFYNNDVSYMHRRGIYLQANNGNHPGGEDVRIYNNDFYWLDAEGHYHTWITPGGGDALIIGAQNPVRWHIYNNRINKVSSEDTNRTVIECWQGTSGRFDHFYFHSNIVTDFWGTGIVIGSGVLQGSKYNAIIGNVFVGNGSTSDLHTGIKSNCSQASVSNVIQNNVVVNCKRNYWDSIGSANSDQPTKYYNNISINPVLYHFAAASPSHELFNNRFFDDETNSTLFATGEGSAGSGTAVNFTAFLTNWENAGTQDDNQQIDVANLSQYLGSDYYPVFGGPLQGAGKVAKFNAKDLANQPFHVPPSIGCKEFTSGMPADTRRVRT